MRFTLAITVTSLVFANSVFADCVVTSPLNAIPTEFTCDIEIEYDGGTREGLLVWGSSLEITAPGIYFIDHVAGAGTGEAYYGGGWVGYREVFGNDNDDFPDPTTPMMVDGVPALGVIGMERLEHVDTTILAAGNWDRNGSPVSISLRSPVSTVPEPSAFLCLAAVGLLAGLRRYFR